MSILDRIDNTLAGGLCPCGAEPRPNSAYCSYDCEPTHRSVHTTSDHDGTPMRWRPDLVTAHDDSDLTLIAAFPVGDYHGCIYTRPTGDGLHLRLDDGHRYVGIDVAADQTGDPHTPVADRSALNRVWQRLERELDNHHRLDPAQRYISAWDLWQHQRQAARRARDESTRQRICAWLQANNLNPDDIPAHTPIRIHNNQITVDVAVRENGDLVIDDGTLRTEPITVPLVEPWPAGLHYEHLHTEGLASTGWRTLAFDTPIPVAPRFELSPEAQQQLAATFRRAANGITAAFRGLAIAAEPLRERMQYFVDIAYEPHPEPADHPLARVTAQRRNQQHGPQQRPRPPRQIRR